MGQALFVAIAFIATLLILVPLNPALPGAGIDASWHYGMNVVVAQHLRFGKDVIFTFGPLASVYTRAYHPATDSLMLVCSAILACAIFAGMAAITPERRRIWLLGLPVVLSLGWSRDIALLIIPVLLLLVAEKTFQRRALGVATLCLLATACALLPLVKTSMTVMVLACTLLSVISLWRKSLALAISLLIVELIATVLAWVASGQALGDILAFFLTQGPLISGYTDGMSATGNIRDVLAYLLVGTVLTWELWRSRFRNSWRVPFAAAFLLFVCFKGGFVRHDGHALLAALALAFVGFIVFVMHDTRRGYVPLIAGILGWAYIASGYQAVGPNEDVQRLGVMLKSPLSGMWTRISDPQSFSNRFKASTLNSRRAQAFPEYHGTADVYPWDLASLLASEATWKPRPVIQSYAVYTPELATWNRQHLETDPPSRIYLSVNPIDGHYPSLEDGASWPAMMRQFEPTSLTDEFAILERRSTPWPVGGKPLISASATLGGEFAIPPLETPIWASIDVEPTWSGRLFRAIFKLPPLSIVLRYQGGSTRTYRFIPGMAKGGFLLSPTVTDAEGFVALQSSFANEYFAARRPVSFRIEGASGTRFLWRMTYNLTLSSLPVHESALADRALLGQSSESPRLSDDTGGDCHIDTVNGVLVTGTPLPVGPELIRIRGWAAADAKKGVANKGVWLAFVSQDGRTRLQSAHKVTRRDVSAFFQRPEMYRVGFDVLFDARQLEGSSQVRVVQDIGSRSVVCAPAVLTLNPVAIPQFQGQRNIEGGL